MNAMTRSWRRSRPDWKRNLGTLKTDVKRQVTAIVNGQTDSEAFYKNILDHMVVYKDCHVEVHLNLLPQKWVFVLEQMHRTNVQNQAENVEDFTGPS